MALSPYHPQSQTRCFFPDKLGYLVPVGFLAQHTLDKNLWCEYHCFCFVWIEC